MDNDNLTSNPLNPQPSASHFNRQRLIEDLRRNIERCDFMHVYRQGKPILVVTPDRDLATVASYLADGVSGESFTRLHAAGDVLGIYEAWGSPYATFDAEPGDEVRVLFTPPVFIVQRTGKTLE